VLLTEVGNATDRKSPGNRYKKGIAPNVELSLISI
jgi:hypothetical protein